MEFRWDENKNGKNRKKHGISFEVAAEVFDDPLHVSILDRRFDYFDERWITIGTTKDGSVVVVVGHLYYLMDNGEEVIKIITARKASKKEKKQYETIG